MLPPSGRRPVYLRLLPLFVCVLAILSFLFTGRALNRFEFAARKPAMEMVASSLANLATDETLNLRREQYSEELGDFFYVVQASRQSADDLVVVYFYGNGFPLKHSAWYFSSADNPPTKVGWPKQERIEKNWFKVGD